MAKANAEKRLVEPEAEGIEPSRVWDESSGKDNILTGPKGYEDNITKATTEERRRLRNCRRWKCLSVYTEDAGKERDNERKPKDRHIALVHVGWDRHRFGAGITVRRSVLFPSYTSAPHCTLRALPAHQGISHGGSGIGPGSHS
jgi:hypothetical protein